MLRQASTALPKYDETDEPQNADEPEQAGWERSVQLLPIRLLSVIGKGRDSFYPYVRPGHEARSSLLVVQLRLKRARQSEQTILTCSGVPGRKRELALANPVGAASRLRLCRDKLGENTPTPP